MRTSRIENLWSALGLLGVYVTALPSCSSGTIPAVSSEIAVGGSANIGSSNEPATTTVGSATAAAGGTTTTTGGTTTSTSSTILATGGTPTATSGTTSATGGTTTVTPTCGALGCGAGTCNEPNPQAQVPFGSLTIPSQHPRLWFDSTRLARARAWYAANPFVPRDPVDGVPETYIDLPLASLLSGDLTKCASPITWLMGLILDTTRPGDDARWVGEAAILTYDWCYDALTDAQRATLIPRWNGFLDAFNTNSWGGLTMPYNNYYWGFLRNTLDFAITTFGENDHAQALLDSALVSRWQDSSLPWGAGSTRPLLGLGGVAPEGSQYGRYLLAYGVVPFVTTSLYGREVYDESRFFQSAVYATVYMTPMAQSARADGSPYWDMFPFGDDERWLHQDNKVYDSIFLGDFMHSMAELWKDRQVGQIAQRWVETAQPRLSLYVTAAQTDVASVGFDTLPLDYYAPGAGTQFVKNTWDAGGTAMMVQLSYGMDPPAHQHFDSGTFQLWRAGQWLTRETVSYTENIVGWSGLGTVPANQTHGHNGILFHGVGAAWGTFDGYPKVTRLETQDAYAYSATDLHDAYRNTGQYEPAERDNPYVASIVREFLYLRALDTLLVFDRLGASADSQTKVGWTGDILAPEAVEKTFLLHATASPTISGNVVTITAGTQQLLAHFLVPAAPTLRVVNEGSPPVGQYRVEADTSGSALSYFVTALELGGPGATALAPTVAEASDGFTVTLKRGALSAVVSLAKGAASSGGTVSINGAAATPLRTTVQPITVTDCGPVWGN